MLVSAPNVYSSVAKVGDLSHPPRGLRHKLLSIVFATLIFQPRFTFAATHSVRGCLITSPFWQGFPVHHRWIDGSIVDRSQTIQQTSVLCRLVLLARIATVGVAATSPTLVSAAALNCTHYNCSVASPVLFTKAVPAGGRPAVSRQPAGGGGGRELEFGGGYSQGLGRQPQGIGRQLPQQQQRPCFAQPLHEKHHRAAHVHQPRQRQRRGERWGAVR